MKRFLITILVLASCSPRIAPTSTPEVPVIPTDTVIKYVSVPGPIKYDTVHDIIIEQVMQKVAAYPDTLVPLILSPSGGDDWLAAQMMLNTYGFLRLGPGVFKMSQGLLRYSIIGGKYQAVGGGIYGASDAQNSVIGLVSTIRFTNPQSFGIAVQLGKSFYIENINEVGPYTKASSLTVFQIDTLSYSGWQDGVSRFTATSPCAGIVIDPFSDRGNFPDTSGMYPGYSTYYPSGMNQSGSTAIKIIGCNIQNFPVGILITAVNQQNGECARIDDDQIIQCASAIAFTHAQAKTNYVDRLMVWGQVHTILDGVHYGILHGDAATIPVVNGMNIAGINYDLIEADTRAFSASLSHIYGEGIFKLGFTGSAISRGAGVHFDDLQMHLQNEGISPDFWYRGGGTLFTGCVLQYYNGGIGPRRIVLNDGGDQFIAGTMSGPPVVVSGQGEASQTSLSNVNMFYDYTLGTTLSTNSYDSITGGYMAQVTIDRTTFNGYYLSPDTAGLKPYMFIMTRDFDQIDPLNLYHATGVSYNYQTPLGYYNRRSGDTIFLQYMGVNVHSGSYPIYISRLK